MKNLRLKLAVAALVLGLGSAMATTHHAFANKSWGHRTDGSYVDLTGVNPNRYSCAESEETCIAVYPATQNPNTNPANPVSIIFGTFSGL
ncbi:MAG: DUF6520 family protein [Bacteroidota bacterium]